MEAPSTNHGGMLLSNGTSDNPSRVFVNQSLANSQLLVGSVQGSDGCVKKADGFIVVNAERSNLDYLTMLVRSGPGVP